MPSWEYSAVSVTGTKHVKQAKGCEDVSRAFWIKEQKTLVLIAADGAGSAHYAALGAAKVVDFIHKSSQEQLEQRPEIVEAQEALEHFLAQLAEQAREELMAYAAKFVEGEERELEGTPFATTLLLCLCTPRYLASLQIGDGFMLKVTQDASFELLFQPSKGTLCQ